MRYLRQQLKDIPLVLNCEQNPVPGASGLPVTIQLDDSKAGTSYWNY